MRLRAWRGVWLAGVMGVVGCGGGGGGEGEGGESVAGAAAADSVVITEWQVPWAASRPRDPDVAPDGRVWFVGQVGNYLAVLDPERGEFRRYALAEGVLPHNLVVGDDGMVWYAGNQAAHIGRMDPADGAIRVIDMPDTTAFDPHTLVFDDAGDIWFTVQHSAFVGRLDTDAERVELRRMPAGSRPYGIVSDPAGGAWAVLFGTNRIVRIAPDLAVTDFDLPAADARPRRLARSSDGIVWYVDHARGTLGRLDPATGEVVEIATPGGAGSRPYAMAIDDRDRLWFVETGAEPNRLVGYDPGADSVIAIAPIPSGGGSVRHMVFHEPTRSIWFGTDANTIGRARLP